MSLQRMPDFFFLLFLTTETLDHYYVCTVQLILVSFLDGRAEFQPSFGLQGLWCYFLLNERGISMAGSRVSALPRK